MAETFEFSVKAATVIRMLDRAEKRMAYTIANALNNTAKAIQKVEKEKAATRLVLRDKKDFILRQVAVIAFASVKKGVNQTTVSIAPKKPRLILPGLEVGDMRQPAKGRNIAVPALGGARPTRSSPIPPDLYLKQLELRGKFSKKGKKGERLIGRRGTFLVPDVGVLQRIGDRLRMLYVLVPPFRLPVKLKWIATARQVANDKFANILAAEVKKTVDYATRGQ